MAHEKYIDIFDMSRSMLKYPWLEYPGRTKGLKKALAPVYLSLSCHQIPREEFPPSLECWRQHPSKPHAEPYCYFKKPEIFTHWHTLHDQQQKQGTQKMLQKMRDHPRYLRNDTPFQKIHLPMMKLTVKSQTGPKPLHPTKDLLKWQRLKDLTEALRSPREDEQFYAAQALGSLGIGDKFVMDALLQVAQTGSEKVKYEACRALAVLGCLNKHVIQSLIKQLKGQHEGKRLETLTGLRVALNSWAAIPKDKRTQVGHEGKLIPVLQMLIQKPSSETAMEAALCLGFLRPCSPTAREFLLRSLCRGPMPQRMKALRMLVKMMCVYSAEVTVAILDQLCHSRVLEHRFEATQMLKTIGLEEIQAQGLEELTFDLLWRKIYNEPFLALRQAVAETVDELRMKPMMINLVEEQLMGSRATARQEAVVSAGVLGIRSPQVFHLLLDMLDKEKSQSVKRSLQETLILLASTDPWIQKKLQNKILFVYEEPKTNKKAEPTRFRKKPEDPEELNIYDFRLAQLNPLSVAKSSASWDQQKMLSAQKGSACFLTSAFPPSFPKLLKHNSGHRVLGAREQLQVLAKASK